MKKDKYVFRIVLFFFALIFFIFPRSASVSSSYSYQIIQLTNQVRQKYNLPSLKVSFKLNKVAERKAQDMLTNQYFSHISPEGKSPWDWLEEENYLYSVAGENLAAEYNSPKEVIAAWLSSPSHRSNILDPDFKEIGVAVASGYFQYRNTTIIVQNFGTPLLNIGE